MIKKLSGRRDLHLRVPKRSSARDRKFRKAAHKIHRKYAALFKRLSE